MKWQIQHQLKAAKPQERINQIINILLLNRGLKTKSQIKNFYHPPHPNKLSLQDIGFKKFQLNKAIKRIQKAINNQEQIIVYGDYDADGICATAIVWEVLHNLGANVMPYIPDRFTEGYGIKIDPITKLQSGYPDLKLIITVDQGIVAFEAAQYCQEQGIDLIITDHHQADKKLPPAHSIVHTTEISGSGVAYWLAFYLINEVGEANEANYLDLATIGTIADVIPLLGINRSLIYHGLKALTTTHRPGLQALFQIAGVDSHLIEPYHIGFLIAPRINAMGRLQHGIQALRLLCTRNPIRARKLAHQLNQTNQLRQQETETAFQQAYQQAKQITQTQPLIIVGDPSYPEGVIGLVASKLTEIFYKPAVVYTHTEQGIKASARSINEYNIIQALRQIKIEFISAGGHPMAAGFSLPEQLLPELTQQLNFHAQEALHDQTLQPTLEIDTQIKFSDISNQLYSQIQEFSPFGNGNPQPVFATQDVYVITAKLVGKQNHHLKLRLQQNNFVYEAIAFNQADKLGSLKIEQPINIAYQITENIWNGKRSLELKIKDIQANISHL